LLQIQKQELTQKEVSNFLTKHFYSRKESIRDFPLSFEKYFSVAKNSFRKRINDNESERKALKKFVKKWINNNW